VVNVNDAPKTIPYTNKKPSCRKDSRPYCQNCRGYVT